MRRKSIFKRTKDRINSEKEINDVSLAGRNINLSTTTFYSAMRKDSFDDLTSGERLYIVEMVRLLDERKESINSITESLAEKC